MKNENIVLMYHDVISEECRVSGFQKTGAWQYTLSVEHFEEHVKRLEDYRQVEYTFDDGGCSFLHTIAPVLEKYGKRGVFFIATKYIGTPGFLTEEAIKELDQRGHQIAAHSHTHPTKISTLSVEYILREWSESKQILERIVGHEVTMAAVPGGAVSKAVLLSMAEVGFTNIYISEPTTEIKNLNSSLIIGRFAVTRRVAADDLVRLVEHRYVRLQWQIRYKLLSAVKWLLGSNYNIIKQKLLKVLQ